ncbi:PREDICTED: Holliday junction recognition protein [Dipodomys ordii]|uniref:Holliday junction recognition protein n=1 Tax=Dipodomys ordii TaxID=10020 RepID=A0A1S3G0B7_DIPOR|nr:PREDICTED: Holliday junction recognition protein [Dipodomys ordii]
MEAGSPGAGDPEGELLLRRLRESRRRFQRRMQQLIEKYSQPFEDDPLVQMATLTYETPQGLRIWGGRLIKEKKKKPIQDSPVKVVSQIEDLVQAGPGSSKHSPCHLQVLRTDADSSDASASSDSEESLAGPLMPAVPGSPLKDELRRKYLAQADLLLRGAEDPQGAHSGKDILVMSAPAWALPAAPAPDPCQGGSAGSPSDPAPPASFPGNDSILLGTSSNSYLSSQSFEADDICNVTISDLYAGMLHSMSRLLSTKPGSIISTKTSIVQHWKRPPRRSRVPMREMGWHGNRHFRRNPKERAAPSSEPGKDTGVLIGCKNLSHVARHMTDLKLKSAFLQGNKHEVHRFDPTWKELQVPSLTHVAGSPMHRKLGDREDRLRALMWLISPVKMVSRPKPQQGLGEHRVREIEIQFTKLHRECLLYPRKQLPLPSPPGAWAVDVYRGGSGSPGGPRALETHRLSLPFSQARAKGQSEAFGNVDRCEANSCPRSDVSPVSKGRPFQSPDRPWRTSDLLPRTSSRMLSEAASPTQASSVPRTGPLGGGRSHYNEIKEKFDKLHQQCCQASPRQAKARPGNTRAEVRQTRDSGTSRVDFLSFQKLKASPQWCLRSPWGTAWATTEHALHPTKRRRLSYPEAKPQDFAGEGTDPSCPPWEKKSTSLQMEEKNDVY